MPKEWINVDPTLIGGVVVFPSLEGILAKAREIGALVAGRVWVSFPETHPRLMTRDELASALAELARDCAA